MNFWYEISCNFVTSEYGRYEAVRPLKAEEPWGAYTWTPVLAGPQPDDGYPQELGDFVIT